MKVRERRRTEDRVKVLAALRNERERSGKEELCTGEGREIDKVKEQKRLCNEHLVDKNAVTLRVCIYHSSTLRPTHFDTRY